MPTTDRRRESHGYEIRTYDDPTAECAFATGKCKRSTLLVFLTAFTQSPILLPDILRRGLVMASAYMIIDRIQQEEKYFIRSKHTKYHNK